MVTATQSGIQSWLQSWLATAFPDARSICSATGEVAGNVDPSGFSHWAAPADVDVTVVRTPMGVAETGSILLTETELAVTTAAVLARHLVVLLDPADIVENIHVGPIGTPPSSTPAYAVLLSGPSGCRRHRWRHGAPGEGGDHPDRDVGAAHRRLRSRVADSRCLVVAIPVSREPLCS